MRHKGCFALVAVVAWMMGRMRESGHSAWIVVVAIRGEAALFACTRAAPSLDIKMLVMVVMAVMCARRLALAVVVMATTCGGGHCRHV